MRDPVLPEAIQKAVGAEKYTVDKIGESGSEVRIYEHYVLKIQPQSPETDNEYQIAKLLKGCLPVPSIPVYEIHNGLAYTLMTKAEGKMLCDMDYHKTPELLIDILPNIFAKGDRISGFIDLGKAGPADRWQDIAIAIRSLDHNFDGRYFNGKPIFDFKPQMLLDALGVEMNEEKYRYYYLLDELF